MLDEINSIASKFNISGNIIDIESISNGKINKTYIITYIMNTGEKKNFILQEINTEVFKNPYLLMENIENVTNWISNYKNKINDIKPSLKIIKSKDNKLLVSVLNNKGEKQYYRMYNYIENSISYNKSTDRIVAYNIGASFGNFDKMLIEYPNDKIKETIIDFHNTGKKYEKFLNDIKLDICGRVKNIKKEIEFVIKNSDCLSVITNLLDNNEIPIRVVHNDTKMNNVMLNKNTHDYLTVIDLDTVMCGSVLYDYGDGIRSIISSALTEEDITNKSSIIKELFENYTDGYLSEMAKILTQNEINHMGISVIIMTLELGIRFLDDYINEDIYFNVDYDKQNLDRARAQFELFYEIKNRLLYINDYIAKKYKEYRL